MNNEVKRYAQESNSGGQDILVTLTESFSSAYIGSSLMHGELENGRGVTLKFSRIQGGTEREYAGLALAYNHGISVPEPIAIVTREEEPTNGLILERVYGETLAQSSSPEKRQRFGQEVRKLHDIDVPGFGILSGDVSQFQEMEPYVGSWLAKILPYLKEDEGKILLMDLWNQAKPIVLAQKPVFLQHDVNDNNVMVDAQGKLTLLDFEWWQGGDPMDDLGLYLYHNVRQDKPEDEYRDFLLGYNQGQPLDDSQKLDLLFHTVLAAGRVVSFCARLNPSRLEEAQKDFDKITHYVRTRLI